MARGPSDLIQRDRVTGSGWKPRGLDGILAIPFDNDAEDRQMNEAVWCT